MARHHVPTSRSGGNSVGTTLAIYSCGAASELHGIPFSWRRVAPHQGQHVRKNCRQYSIRAMECQSRNEVPNHNLQVSSSSQISSSTLCQSVDRFANNTPLCTDTTCRVRTGVSVRECPYGSVRTGGLGGKTYRRPTRNGPCSDSRGTGLVKLGKYLEPVTWQLIKAELTSPAELP
jgi:hypothetical protein